MPTLKRRKIVLVTSVKRRKHLLSWSPLLRKCPKNNLDGYDMQRPFNVGLPDTTVLEIHNFIGTHSLVLIRPKLSRCCPIPWHNLVVPVLNLCRLCGSKLLGARRHVCKTLLTSILPHHCYSSIATSVPRRPLANR